MRLIYFIAFVFFLSEFGVMQAGITSDSNYNDNPEIVLHNYPTICPGSELYSVKINGEIADVYYATVASFVSFECDETVEVEIDVKGRFRNVRVLPLSLGIEAEVEGQTIRFKMPAAAKLYLETELEEHLFIYGNRIQKGKPDPDDPAVNFYKAGQVYEVGELVIGSGETLYVEGGAVLRGNIRVTASENVTISGTGVIDGSYYRLTRRGRPHLILIEDCREVEVKDLIMVESPTWNVTLYHSENINIDNVKQISHGRGTDGVDIVSSHHVNVRNCILRNDDDCVVVKSYINRYRTYTDVTRNTHLKGVKDVRVEHCSIQTNQGGHVFEIGHELIESPVSDIVYIDCDVLGAHDFGGVFGIHNSDAAKVSNIHYENIRIDHFYNKLIDIRILKSRYSTDDEPGSIENISFRDIYITASRYNTGYSISLIGGYDTDHKVKNIRLENLKLNDLKVTNADQLDLYIKQAEKISIK